MDGFWFDFLIYAIPSVIVPLLAWLSVEAIRYMRSCRIGAGLPDDGKIERSIAEMLERAGDRIVEALIERTKKSEAPPESKEITGKHLS